MSTISILPTALQDYHPIAALETHVFHDDPFSIVGFGPLRASPSNIARRAANLAAPSSRPGEWSLVTKAVDERGVVVGAAVWGLVTGRKGEVNGGKEEGKEKGEWKQEDWGESANQRFCEEVFVRGDEHMVRSCGVGDYAKLSVLIVDPTCQRRGIGTKLLEHGLKGVDKHGLQCVLGASKEGLGLYKKFGFEMYEVMEIKFWEYEGGEGFGVDEHAIMHRPARKV